jgi:hypothetical protein
MKAFFSALVIVVMGFNANAQTINWKSLQKKQKHILSANLAADYAFTYGGGYGHQLSSKLPIILNASFSIPSGNKILDDYKTKIGGQVNWLQSGNFYFSSQLQGIFRRYENSYARLLNFGAVVSTTAGYYKPHWFIAADAGFDKAIVTHFKHSALYKSNFPAVKDGWYEPSTGGNFYYGLQTGYSVKKADIYLRAGKVIEQNFETASMLPFYAELGFNFKLKKR